MRKDITYKQTIAYLVTTAVVWIGMLVLTEYYFANFRDTPTQVLAEQMASAEVK